MSDDKRVPPSDVHPSEEAAAMHEAEAEAAARDSSPAGAGTPVASGSPPAAATPPADPAVDRIIVNVEAAVRPVVVWLCPGCQAKLEGQDSEMIKYLVKGGQVAVACKACGVKLMLRIPQVQEVKPNIILAGW